MKMAGARSINRSFSSFTVPSRQRFNRPWMFPVMVSLKKARGARSSETMTSPRAFFSSLVAVSSTSSLRPIFKSSLTTVTTRIAHKMGTIFEKSREFCWRMSSVSQPMALGVNWVRAAETAITSRMRAKACFCLRSSSP